MNQMTSRLLVILMNAPTELARLIRDFPGESPVLLDCVTSQGPVRYALGSAYRVSPAPDFYAEVRALLGESALA